MMKDVNINIILKPDKFLSGFLSLISGVCNGNKKTSGGFKWKFI